MAAKKKQSRIGLWIFIVLLLLGGMAVYKVFGPNTGSLTKGEYLYVHTGTTYEGLLQELEAGSYVSDLFSFKLLASRAGLPQKVHPGRYRITRGMSNYNMVRMLHAGRQVPVKLVIHKLRTRNDLVHLLGANLEADSNEVRSLLADAAFLKEYELDSNTAMCIILPDTYEFYWNTTAEKALRKIARNYTRYWTDDRKAQARSHNLTPPQATTVASIVEEETNMTDDKPKIASVYLNRLRTGMRLQADPTVKFAVGDFTIRRIGGAMLQVNSPYNTYMYGGLPPGPICTPSMATIDAVITAPQTSYIYFCAKADFSGYSSFASNYAEHMKNAAAYTRALDARNIH